MERIKIQGRNQVHLFTPIPFKDFQNSETKNCIAIVANYVAPHVYSMFFIKYVSDLRNLNEFFDPKSGNLLFVKEIESTEKAKNLIDEIILANPSHPIKEH